MKTVLTILIFPILLHASSHERAQKFFVDHYEAAEQLYFCDGIPIELSLAVWALESKYGRSTAAQYNNLGGVKVYIEGKKQNKRFATKYDFYRSFAAIFQQPCYSNDLRPKTIGEYLEAMEWGCCSYHRSKEYTHKIKWIIKNFKLDEMKILNLYACLGGNRLKWGDSHEITAVELDPEAARLYKERFPSDIVVVGDAHQYLLNHYKEFDFIWSSPPCPTHSRARFWNSSNYETTTKAVYPDLKLYEEILFLDHYFKGKYVVENVIPYYTPLIPAKKRGRHLYWTNFLLPSNLNDRRFSISQTKNELKALCKFHDYDFTKYQGKQSKVKMARNLVDYEAGKTILETALGIYKSNQINQTTLF